MNHPSRTIALATIALTVGCSCGGETHHALLENGVGLTEGSVVLVSGIQVGRVHGVRVVDGNVDVTFAFEGDHEISLRDDGCALALPGRGEEEGESEDGLDRNGSVLVIQPGEGDALAAGRPLPQCQIPLDEIAAFLTSLGEGVTSAGREGLEALRQGAAAAASGGAPSPSLPPSTPPPPSTVLPPSTASPLPSTPLPPSVPSPLPLPSHCARVTVRVAQIETLGTTPLHLPQGGARLHLAIANDGEEAIVLPPIREVTFVDLDHRAMTAATLPGQGDWFMPIQVPAHSTSTVTVALAAGGGDPSRLGELTIGRVTRPVAPFDDCTVRQAFTAAPRP